jgi:hypothetical protein
MDIGKMVEIKKVVNTDFLIGFMLEICSNGKIIFNKEGSYI